MKERETVSYDYPINGLRLCIDGYGEDIKGRLYSRLYPRALEFENCGEMLLRGDLLFDRCGYPQAFQEKRRFLGAGFSPHTLGAPKIYLGSQEIAEKKGTCGTWDILILSRRRAGWQGILRHPQKGEISRFQSEMELLENIQKTMKIEEGKAR